jgi:A/G-specific adenine glycosylase
MVARICQGSDDTIKYIRKQLIYWGRRNFSHFPWRYETNNFHALIAELLLQRTKAEQVVAVYQRFKERFPDPSALSDASIQEIEAIISPLGLKWRAKFLLELGKRLTEEDGNIPCNILKLQELPGVGPYAAAAYISLHGGQRVPILDSNVVRFYGRFFGFETGPETRRDRTVLELAEHITPKRSFKDFNYGLLDFTRLICRPKPNHGICPISAKCALCGGAA